MRASVVKNINNLIPDDVIPPAILKNDNISVCSTPTRGVASMSQTTAYALRRSDGPSTDCIPSLSISKAEFKSLLVLNPQ